MTRIKKALYLAGGLCWLSFGGGFGLLLVQFFAQGTGMQFFGIDLGSVLPVSPGTVLMGLVWVTGLSIAAFVCLAVSFGLFERGLEKPVKAQKG